jgi:GWxTD domain-containing protein
MRATRFRNNLTLSLLFALLSLFLLPARAQDPTRVRQGPYRKWLNEDVRWIISDQERAEFKGLSDDMQKDKFIEAFWERRTPTPGAPENTFKEEHYRRLAYANQHFAQGIPGWKTERGRFYIMYGPPDYVVRHVGVYKAPRLGELQKGAYNSEEWHWIYIEGLGSDLLLEFIDTCDCGRYHLARAENGVSQRKLGPSSVPDLPCLIDQILCP